MKLSSSTQGLLRAERDMLTAASRISKWGLTSGPDEAVATETGGDTVQIDGVARPRRFGSRASQEISLSDEAIRMKKAEFSFKANLNSLGSLLEMQDSLLEMMRDQDRKESS